MEEKKTHVARRREDSFLSLFLSFFFGSKTGCNLRVVENKGGSCFTPACVSLI